MKNIVVCCDGTSNGLVNDPTNVLRFYRSLERNEEQLAYYDSGVGTLPNPGMLTQKGQRASRIIDMAIGSSVENQACKAYRFLVRHWEPGDQIYLIGFSRGAYAVRALAGMLHSLGMARRELEHLDTLGWTVYCEGEFRAAANFRFAFSQEGRPRVHFMGVWDTVSAFGSITNYRTLPYTANNESIDHIRHAVALDERRTCFQANLFRPDKTDQHQSFEEIWFPGSHGDVGGGYPEEEAGIAKATLEWMYQEAKAAGCQLKQDTVDFFLGRSDQKHPQTKPNIDGTVHNSIRGFVWNLLEFIPRRQWNHDLKPERMSWYFPNLYRRRKVPKDAKRYDQVVWLDGPSDEATG
ncbi:DUF2235 domain-containing protein [Bremerella sp. JC817]|uniref:T6SS phospholipase effector Tle1-like catalytic domain-containing protein n=1 Tax=Bremerella sp. JC817 TaxID=3231756 RepID=UPI0034577A02